MVEYNDYNVDSWQSWENLLDYIKGELGAPVIQIELTDDQIMDIIKMHTLPMISRYFPLTRYYFLTENENCVQHNPTRIYKIKNFPYKILKIERIIAKPNIIDYNQNIAVALFAGDITNVLAANNMMQSKTVVMADDSYIFRPPNTIELIKSDNNFHNYNDFIAELACVHDNPTTLDADGYDYLKDLSLAEIKIRLGAIREKFQNFSTPVGQVQLQSTELKQEGKQEKRDILEELKRMPPDQYIWDLN